MFLIYKFFKRTTTIIIIEITVNIQINFLLVVSYANFIGSRK